MRRPWGRQRRTGEQRGGLAGGKGLRQRQGNTQGPGKDPTKLGILRKIARIPKIYLLNCFQ